jgi:ArsR family transcriptional regulator
MQFTGCCPGDRDLEIIWKNSLEKEIDVVNSHVFNDLADIMKIVSNPLRIKILYLLKKKDHSVIELTYVLKEPQNLLSYNLGILKKAGLVESFYRSRRKTYHLADGDAPLIRFLEHSLSEQ